MTEEEIRAGLTAGKTLIQEEWSTPEEIAAVDRLIVEGFAEASAWEYKDNFQCERRRVYKKP